MPDGRKRYSGTLILVLIYSCLSILYFEVLDPKFYLRDVLNYKIVFAVPVPYLLLTAAFIALYSCLSRDKIRLIAYPVIAISMLLPLAYLFTDLRIGMCGIKPFSWGRDLYAIYVEVFYLLCMLSLSFYLGTFFKKLSTDNRSYLLGMHDLKIRAMVFHAPILIWFIAIIAKLSANGFILYSSVFSAVFLGAMAFNLFDGLRSIIKPVLKILGNEKFFLAAVYILAFAVRYFWGTRLLAGVGENFILASDDAVSYDPMAAILARGEVLPKANVFGLNGFGYWHFLGIVYRIFGLHNFRAVIVIQSLIGAAVPVFTYMIAKRIFKVRPVSVISSLFTSFNLTLVFLSVVIGIEALYIPLFFLAVTVAAYFLTAGSFDYKKGLILGSLFGLANNIRGELLFAPFILVFLLFISKMIKRPKDMMIAACSVFLGFALLASIQHIICYKTYGEYHLTQNVLGNIYGIDKFTGENKILDGLGFNPFKSIHSSLRVFFKEPVYISELVLSGFFKRSVIYYFQPNFGVFDPIFLVNPASGYFFRYPVFLQLYGYIFILSGIWFSFIGKEKENIAAKMMLVIFALYISSIYTFVLIVNSRCRGVLIPVAALFAAYGISMLYRRTRESYRYSSTG